MNGRRRRRCLSRRQSGVLARDEYNRQARQPRSSCQTTLAPPGHGDTQPYLGVDEEVVVVSTDVICTQLILPVNRLPGGVVSYDRGPGLLADVGQTLDKRSTCAQAPGLPERGSVREPKLREHKHRSHRQDHYGEQGQSPTTHPMQVGAGKSHNDQ
jgi:hypothetical protein